jgi:hypothetical protein
MNLLNSLFISTLLIFTPISNASGPILAEAPKVVTTVNSSPNTSTPQELIHKYATKYNVSESQMLATLKCESGFNASANGDNNTSHGIAQINLPSHPSVTHEEAHDPDFAIEWMAKQFSLGHQRIWSCYNILYPERSG